jgi:hypothetical protein
MKSLKWFLKLIMKLNKKNIEHKFETILSFNLKKAQNKNAAYLFVY